MPLALSFATFDDWMHPAIVFGIYGSIELFNYAVLEPWLYAARTGVSPVGLLLAAAFWTWLWGLAGLLLSVPITVCLVVMGKYIPQLEFLEVLLGDEPALEPYERLYQRLLTSNRDEADVVLERALREHSLREVCDIAIVPALQLLEADFARGALKPQRRRAVLDQIQQWADELLEGMQRTDGRGAMSWPIAIDSLRSGRRSGDAIIAKLLHRNPDQPGNRRARRLARSLGGGGHDERRDSRTGGRLRAAAGGRCRRPGPWSSASAPGRRGCRSSNT